MTIPRRLISITEAAELLGVSQSTAYRLARENRIPVIRIGKAVRVNLQRLEAWIEEQTDHAA